MESIARITPELLESCHKTFYHPSNMVLCVEGNVEPRKVLQMAAAVVPVGEKQTIWRDHGAPEKPESACQEIAVEMEVSAPSFLLGFKAEPEGSLRYKLVGELAAELLAGESSPLYAKLYQEGLIDKTFGVEFDSDGETAHFVMGGESSDPAKVAEHILSEGVRIAWTGVDDALFHRVRKAVYGAKVRALNSFEHTCIQMAQGHFEGYRYLEFCDLYQQITRQEVEELLRDSITGAQRPVHRQTQRSVIKRHESHCFSRPGAGTAHQPGGLFRLGQANLLVWHHHRLRLSAGGDLLLLQRQAIWHRQGPGH